MWSLFDNLGAVLIAGTVTLVVVGLRVMGGDAQVASTQRASGRTVLTQTTDWLERDLTNIGYDVPAHDAALIDFAWSDTGGHFTFLTMSDTSATAVADTVRYVYRNAQGVTRLERYRVDGSHVTLTTTTDESLAGLTIGLRDAAGAPVGSDLGRAVRLDVSLRMHSLLGGDGQYVWTQRLLPLNLRRRSA